MSSGRRPHAALIAGRKRFGSKWVPRRAQPKQIKNIKKSIKKIQNQVDLKFSDTSGGLNPATAGNFRLLNSTVQGTTDITRIGDEVSATSIQVKGWVKADPTITSINTDVSRAVRIIVFWDAQANGAAPTLAQLLDLSVATDGTQAPYNHTFQKRFKILKDKFFAVNPFYVTTGPNVADTMTFFRFKRKLGRRVKYNGNAGTIADIVSNSLYVVTITDSVANANIAQVNLSTRFIFKDA